MDDTVVGVGAVIFLVIAFNTFLLPIEPLRADDDELTEDAFDPVI
jgi:hypothetical protein